MTSRAPRRLAGFAAAASLAGLVTCASVPDPRIGDACAWEARFRPAGERFEPHLRQCLERIGAAIPNGGGWQPGFGSREGDPEECLARAHAGVERYRACMRDGGWREVAGGRVPYAKPGADPRLAALASRRCAERSFEGTRYGPFTSEFEACLRRRGWHP